MANCDQTAIGPIEPAPSPWQLPDPRQLGPQFDGEDLVALGADLAPGTLLSAYRSGLFPMHVRVPVEEDEATEPAHRALGWWCPDPRAVLPLVDLRVSRSLRRSIRRFDVTVDQAFDDVMAGCAAPHRPDGWINDEIAAAYGELHALGWAHSVEVWSGRELVGGLYGVAIGGLFAGESMFHLVRDASKVALVHLVSILRQDGLDRLLDVQWATDHLTSLGAVEWSRGRYLARLAEVGELPLPPGLGGDCDT